MDWIDLAQDRDQWKALMYKVMNLRVPENVREIFEWLRNLRLLKKGSAPWS
jgi:hypothetical protein